MLNLLKAKQEQGGGSGLEAPLRKRRRGCLYVRSSGGMQDGWGEYTSDLSSLVKSWLA